MNYFQTFESPIGPLKISANESAISSIEFHKKAEEERPNPITELAANQLEEYFQGKRKDFSIPLSALGTDFQRSVWQELREIPFGETRSYRDIAEKIGNKKAVRAVGAANGKNPIPIIVPCHRVIGSNGTLTGFAGGLESKKWLLEHESNQLEPRLLSC